VARPHLDVLDGAALREELLDLRRGQGPGQVGHVQLPPLLLLRRGGRLRLRGRGGRDGGGSGSREAEAEAVLAARGAERAQRRGKLGNSRGRERRGRVGGLGAARERERRPLGSRDSWAV